MAKPILKSYKCGCIVKNVNGVWVYSERCNQHKINYEKKANKKIHKAEVKEKRERFNANLLKNRVKIRRLKKKNGKKT